jgi:hypothetical protein
MAEDPKMYKYRYLGIIGGWFLHCLVGLISVDDQYCWFLYFSEYCLTQVTLSSSSPPPGPSLTSGQRTTMFFQLLSGVFFTHSSPSVISPSLLGESTFTLSRILCAILCPSNLRGPIPDGQRSMTHLVGDFPIGKSAYERSRFTHLSKPRMLICDATCCTPHNLRGTRRDSGLRYSSGFLSTLKTPKCRIPTPRDLVPPVPPTIDGSR